MALRIESDTKCRMMLLSESVTRFPLTLFSLSLLLPRVSQPRLLSRAKQLPMSIALPLVPELDPTVARGRGRRDS